MGYDDPPGISFGPFSARIDIRIQDGRAFARRGLQGITIGNFGYLIAIGPNPNRHTVRHELFHQVQFGYFFDQWLFMGTPWWLEASAQWAARAAGSHLNDNGYGPGTLAGGAPGTYANIVLFNFLGSSGRAIWSGESSFTFAEPRNYGAFILSSYLEQRFGAGTVRRTWEHLRFSVFGAASARSGVA